MADAPEEAEEVGAGDHGAALALAHALHELVDLLLFSFDSGLPGPRVFLGGIQRSALQTSLQALEGDVAVASMSFRNRQPRHV